MKKFLFFLVSTLARLTISLKKPYIIGVTGTAGKTTITQFLHIFLSEYYGEDQVYISPYSYNGEYGLPLSILREKNPGSNPLAWMMLFGRAIARLFLPYPPYLILEYGIDHPGEMDYLLSIAVPDIAILGPVSPNHIEQFGDFASYKREKLKLEQAKNIIAFSEWKGDISTEALFYGYGVMSDIDSSHIHQDIDSLSATITVDQDQYQIRAPLFGVYQILNILPLFGVARYLDIDIAHDLVPVCGLLAPQPGRSRLLPGVNNSVIIDGSYNGGYLSITEGLKGLEDFRESHDLVILLGDMRELGDLSESLHTDLAHFLDSFLSGYTTIDLVLVGPMMKQWVVPLLDSSHRVYHSLSSREAGRHIHTLLMQSDRETILSVKGSQNTIFLEEAVALCLDSSVDAESVLCRQSIEWQQTKEDFFIELEVASERGEEIK